MYDHYDQQKMDTLSQSELIQQYKKCLKKLSKSKGHQYIFVTEVNDWIGKAYIKYVKECHYAKDPYDYLLHKTTEIDDEETRDYILGICQRNQLASLEEFIEHEVNEMITLDKDEHWIKL